MKLFIILLLSYLPNHQSFLFGSMNGGGGGCGGGCGCCKPPPPPCPPPQPCQCPKISSCAPPPSSCGCARSDSSQSYVTSKSYVTSNVARDDNNTSYVGSYDTNDDNHPERINLPQLSTPNTQTTYEDFKKFLAQAKNEDFTSLDGIDGISSQTIRRHSKSGQRRRREEPRCSNPRLRNIIAESIWDDGPSAAKVRLVKEVRRRLHSNYNVICSEGNFSYFIGNDNFCELRVRGIVCLIFKH